MSEIIKGLNDGWIEDRKFLLIDPGACSGAKKAVCAIRQVISQTRMEPAGVPGEEKPCGAR